MHVVRILAVLACLFVGARILLKIWWRYRVIPWYNFWKDQGQAIATTSGYVTPRTGRRITIIRAVLGMISSRLIIGPVKIVGLKNVKGFKGRLVWQFNHQFILDSLLLARLFMLRRFRFLITTAQIQGGHAFGLAAIGAIPVDHTSRRRSVLAIRGAVKAMKNEPDCQTVIFPEGAFHPEGIQRANWHDGLVATAIRVEEQTGETTGIASAYINYDHDPSHETRLQRLFRKSGLMGRLHDLAMKKCGFPPRMFGAKAFYGATIYIGPVKLVKDLKEMTRGHAKRMVDQLFNQMRELESVAKKPVQALL